MQVHPRLNATRLWRRLVEEPDQPGVLSDAEGSWGAAELRDAVVALAEHLPPATPRCVRLVAPNARATVVALLALLARGHRVLLENPAAPEAERCRRAERAHPAAELHLDPELGWCWRDLTSAPATPETPGVLIATGGSTGEPKLVRLALEAIDGNAWAMARRKGLRTDDRLLCAIPIFHANGLVASLWSGLLAARVHLAARPPLDQIPELVEGAGITVLSGVPTLWQQLLQHPETGALRSLRLAISGAAPLSEPLARAVEASWGCRVLEGYGLTEATCGVCGTPPDDRRPGWVGLPLAEVRVGVRDSETGDVRPEGQGELIVWTPYRAEGYHGDPEGTTAVFLPDGGLRTGDLAEVAADGWVRIVGRRKHLIVRSGFNVVPGEVEARLLASGWLTAAVVLGLPHPVWGEEVAAAIVPAPGAPEPLEEHLAAYLRRELAGYKRPTRWLRLERVPTTPTGKPDLAALRTRFNAPGSAPETTGSDGD